jgi:uncharacterized protein YndB with AHSA1/START domain
MAGEPIERTFPATREQVWEALRHTIADLRYERFGEDASAGTIEFRTGLSLWSWGGQHMTATVREVGPDATQVSLTGGLAVKVQLTSWGEKKRIANKVLTRVEQKVREWSSAPQSGPNPDIR